MSRGPLERGIVISKVTNPVNPRDLPPELIEALKECTIELEYLESGETYLFKTFKTGDNLDIRYKAEFEEGWYNLFEAYVAWWNEHNPADIYLIPEKAKPFMPNLGFNIISVDNAKRIEDLNETSILILKGYTTEFFKFQPIGTTRDYFLDLDSVTIRAELGISPFKSLYEAYKAWCEEAQEAYYLTGEEIIEKRKKLEALAKASQPNFVWEPMQKEPIDIFGKFIKPERKENEMEFTISKEQIKKRLSELEKLRISQINEIEKDLDDKKEDLAKGRPFNSTILGTSNLQQITLHISYLKDLLLAESITCSAQEKDNIFKDFRVEKAMSQDLN